MLARGGGLSGSSEVMVNAAGSQPSSHNYALRSSTWQCPLFQLGENARSGRKGSPLEFDFRMARGGTAISDSELEERLSWRAALDRGRFGIAQSTEVDADHLSAFCPPASSSP